ncbi:MAG: lactate utilization protein [Clostridia bacterium]|nr:lactate utilization protein [Clostridia bacterium]
MEKITKVISALQNNGFTAVYASDGKEALTCALSIIGEGSVGFGGSVTVDQIGLYPALKERNNSVYWHWKGDSSANANTADFYVCSANALTEDGKIVQIDGNGNRVGAMISGPKNVILIVGKNKICADTEQAIKRIKSVSCPQNAKRLGLKLPCAETGECNDCKSPSRMCSITVIFDRPSKCVKKTTVILVDENLGY